MLRLAGVGAAAGVAIGPAHLLGGRIDVEERHVAPGEVEAELGRFATALAAADAELERIQRQIAEREGDQHQYRILEAHRLMLSDVHLVEEARRVMREDLVSAESGVLRAIERIRAVFDRIEDPYFRERGGDVDLVGQHILRHLTGRGDGGLGETPAGAVAVAHDLSPAAVVELRRAGVAALVTEGGGKTSHTAIVARALGLPYVVGVADVARLVRPGARIIVDAGRGVVVVDPDDAAMARHRTRALREAARAHRLEASKAEPATTLDGVAVRLCANVELMEELPVAGQQSAAEIGLFRTEFLYLGRPDLPSEEEQYGHAVAALEAMSGRRITFRTLDLGSDKLPPGFSMPSGPNPALGVRSIRYSLRRRDVFKAQLRALYRAAAVGPVRIMFPLISGVGELRQAKACCEEVCGELAVEGVAHDPEAPVGVMVETPSAAMIADLLATECEFLSVGTNDLIQYAIGADRENENVGYLYHPLHPAILRLVKQVVEGGLRAGTEVAMCGDMAGDPLYTWILLGLGLRVFSMAPQQLPVVKSILRATRLADAEQLVARVMELRTEDEIEGLVTREMQARFPLELDVENASPEAPLGREAAVT